MFLSSIHIAFICKYFDFPSTYLFLAKLHIIGAKLTALLSVCNPLIEFRV